MEETSENRPGYYSGAELADMGLPGFPTSERGARARADQEHWEFIEVKSRGKLGKTRRFRPPPAIAALIDRARLRAAFNGYRATAAANAPLAATKARFIADYNARNGIAAIPGIDRLNDERLDAALHEQPPQTKLEARSTVSAYTVTGRQPATLINDTEGEERLRAALGWILTLAEAQLSEPLTYSVARALLGVVTHWRSVAEQTGQLARLEAIGSAAELYLAIERKTDAP